MEPDHVKNTHPPNNVAITVLGRTYTVKCSKQKSPRLKKQWSAWKTMAKITQGHKHPSPEQIAIVTALNLAAQLEAQPKKPMLKPSQQQLKIKNH